MTDEEIERVLEQADRAWNVFSITQASLYLHKHDRSITFARIEAGLRSIGSKTTFLVAKSLKSKPIHLSSVDLDGKPAQYWLWVCLNGPDEMLKELAREDKTIAQNAADLEQTGILTT